MSKRKIVITAEVVGEVKFGSKMKESKKRQKRESKEKKTKMQKMSSSEVQSRATLDTLPAELALKILSYVSRSDLAKRVSLVCRHLRDLAYSPSLWTELPTNDFRLRKLNSTMSDALFSRCQLLRKLDLEWGPKDSMLLAVKALLGCPKLAELKMEVEDDIRILLTVIGNSSSLRKLSLSGEWNSEALAAEAACLRKLSDLALLSPKGLSGEALVAVGRHCEDLKKFSVSMIHEDKCMITFLDARKDTLQELDVRHNCLTDFAFAGLAQCQQLRSLHLTNMFYLKGIVMDHVVMLSELRSLSLVFLDIPFKKIVRAFDGGKLKQLTSLNFDSNKRLTNRALCILTESCPLLNWLNVEDCNRIRDFGLSAVAKNCPNLAYLKLSRCFHITNAGLVKILMRCRLLEELWLENTEITSEPFMIAFEVNNTLALRELAIDSCDDICIDKNELLKIKELLPALKIWDTHRLADPKDYLWDYDMHGVIKY